MYDTSRGDIVSQQPAKEWDEMSQHQQDEIRARLFVACETRVAVDPMLARRDLWSKLARRV